MPRRRLTWASALEAMAEAAAVGTEDKVLLDEF
jgi:hypothetical protein